MSATWGANFPTITIELGVNSAGSGYGAFDNAKFGTDTFGPDIVWQDITADVRQITTNVGRSREGDRYYGGMSVTVDNRTGNYTPGNSAGAYVIAGLSQIRPRVPIRFKAVWAAVTYQLAYGIVDDWGDQFPSAGTDSITTLSVVDAWWYIASINPPAQDAAGSGETAGQRIQRIASAAAWTLPTSVQSGTNTMQPTTLAQNLSSEALLTADSDGGAIWVDPDGTLVYEGRYSLIEQTRSNTSNVTFGNGGGELPFKDPVMSSGADRLANDISYARVGGTEQRVVDDSSKSFYGGTFTDPRDDLICEADPQVLSVASLALATRKAAEYRPVQLSIQPALSPSLMWPHALGRRIRDRVTVKVKPVVSNIETSHQCFIEGIQQTISPADWTTTFTFSSATPFAAFSVALWDAALWDNALWFF